MSTIAIVTSTGNYAYDHVLRGVYGKAVPHDSVPDSVIFTPADEFKRVSHLFEQLPQIPVRASGIQLREVDEADATLAKAQILFGLGARWASMYAARTPAADGQIPDIGSALLSGERAAVARGVREHLESVGMNVYEVPVLVKGEVLSHGSYIGSAASMIHSMNSVDRTIEIDPAGRPRVLVRSALSGDAAAIEAARLDARPTELPPQAQQAAAGEPMRSPVRSFIRSFFDGPGAGTEPETPAPAQPAAAAGEPAQQIAAAAAQDSWNNFQGIDATVRALAYVVAPNLEALPSALRFMQDAYKNDGAGMHLEPVDVAAVRDLQREELALRDGGDDDFQESGYDEEN